MGDRESREREATRPDDPSIETDTFEVEPLAASGASQPRPPADLFAARRSVRARALRLLIAVGAVLLALAIIAVSLPPARQTLLTLPALVPTHSSAFRLGPAPTDCPPGNPVQPFAQGIGPGVGGPDLYLVGFDGPQATARSRIGVTRARSGWPFDVIVAFAPGFTAPVTLGAEDLTNRTPLQFDQNNGTGLTSAPTFDPQPNRKPTAWETARVYLSIPEAGCYFIHADWPGGSWPGTFFAAGR